MRRLNLPFAFALLCALVLVAAAGRTPMGATPRLDETATPKPTPPAAASPTVGVTVTSSKATPTTRPPGETPTPTAVPPPGQGAPPCLSDCETVGGVMVCSQPTGTCQVYKLMPDGSRQPVTVIITQTFTWSGEIVP